MTAVTLVLLTLAVPADQPAKKAPPSAKVTITAETACMHCTFGVGDSCALCLKVDETTPVVLEGKAAEDLFDKRLTRTVLVVEGTLSVNKDKQLVLKIDNAYEYCDKNKSKAPNKGEAQIEGTVVREKDIVMIRNGEHPIALEGKRADDGKPIAVRGTLSLDKGGKPRLDAKK